MMASADNGGQTVRIQQLYFLILRAKIQVDRTLLIPTKRRFLKKVFRKPEEKQ